MELLVSSELPAVFTIPPFRLRRIVPISGIVLFVGFAAYLPLRMGVARTIRAFAEYPEMWVLFIMLLGGIAMFLRLALPPRSSLARLDIWHDRLRLTPDRMQRLLGDPSVEERVLAQSREIVLCHTSALGLRSGSSIIIRDLDGAERTIKSTCLTGLNERESLKLGEAISAVTKLPVRVAMRSRTDEGNIQEVPWKPSPLRDKIRVIIAWLGSAIPILAGCLVGYYALPTAEAIVIGLAACTSWMLACVFLAQIDAIGEKTPPSYLLATIVTFSALYSISVASVEFLVRTP